MVKRAAIRSAGYLLYPGSTLGESSLPSTTYRQMILSTAPMGSGIAAERASEVIRS